MKFSKIRNIFIFSKKTNYLKNELFEEIKRFWKFQKFENFTNQIDFFWKSFFFIKNLKNDPLTKIWSQMEIAMTLSHGSHTQPESNFNTWTTLPMWHIFISAGFCRRETCSKRSMFQKDAVPLGRGLPTHQYWQSCGKPSTKFPHGGLVEL